MDKPTPDEYAVASLKDHRGWQVLEETINKMVNDAKEKAIRSNITDLSEITRLQGEVSGLTKIVNRVNDKYSRVRKYKE